LEYKLAYSSLAFTSVLDASKLVMRVSKGPSAAKLWRFDLFSSIDVNMKPLSHTELARSVPLLFGP